jgi:ADP-dependent phosphofructokinase/glucokinase
LTKWEVLYGEVIEALPDMARNSKLVLAGFTACVDLSLRLSDRELRLFVDQAQSHPEEAGRKFAASVVRFAKRGIGGEQVYDWERGPSWVENNFELSESLGGTGARTAQTVAQLGGPVLLCLARRSPRMMNLIHPEVFLSSPSKPRRVRDMVPSEVEDDVHYIFEFRRGTHVEEQVVPRSDRLIVRFNDVDLELASDRQFRALSCELAPEAGAGIASGFNSLPVESQTRALELSRSSLLCWRQAGLNLIHLELGGYRSKQEMQYVTEVLAEVCTSIGMNRAELDWLAPDGTSIESQVLSVATQYGFSRVCVHSDKWALALTSEDPSKELTALLTGSAVAASVARTGRTDRYGEVMPIYHAAHLAEPPLGIRKAAGRWLVACPTPYVERPIATVGLGDAFLGATLLALGSHVSLDELVS